MMRGDEKVRAMLKQTISNLVWDMKYRYRVGSEKNIEATWQRVAKAIAQAEKTKMREEWEKAFYRILEGFYFLPGGRILAGAGTKHHVTLFNCFVMDIHEDSLSGIFDALKEGAQTLQQGGGIGYDFSVLRPQGDLAIKTGTPAAGPVSFMRIWDTTCSIMLSTGARRGAMMGVMRCDHPDIEAFIAAKADAHELRHFNVSVMISDAFMTAVKNDADWPLIFPSTENDGEIIYRQWGHSSSAVPCRVYRYIKARDLWQQIIHSAYEYAEPGVLFGDTINRMNNLWYCEQIHATNPCGEIPLPSYGACNLGAINLPQFVSNAFSENATINWAKLEETVRIATRFLDNVVDVSQYPLLIQQKTAQNTRRIGLGLTGLADTLVMMNIRYGSPQAIITAREIMKRIAEATWQTSIALAQEKKPFPLFHTDYLRGEFVKTLDENIQQQLAKHAVRNSHHNAIAPTGTISLLANNVSNGIEPIYQAEYEREVRAEGENKLILRVKDYAYECWQNKNNKNLPPAWEDIHALVPSAHLQMQSVIQQYIDNAISKTINIPRDFPFEKLSDVYTQAYELGLKGCTIFRPNPITGAVLKDNSEGPCCQQE